MQQPRHLGRKAAKLKVVLLIKKKLFFSTVEKARGLETCCLFSSHAWTEARARPSGDWKCQLVNGDEQQTGT